MRSVRPLQLLMLSALLLATSCSAPPADTSAKNSADSQSLPFDRQPRSTGVAPSQSILPSTTTLPEGTPIYIRLNAPLSSASSHSGDVFGAVLDQAIVVNGDTLFDKGSIATGRVLEAKAAVPRVSNRGGEPLPGYLRLVLVSLNSRGEAVPIETSSIFAKGIFRSGASAAKPAPTGRTPSDGEIEFGPDRRLSFRLAQTLDLSLPTRPPRSAAQ